VSSRGLRQEIEKRDGVGKKQEDPPGEVRGGQKKKTKVGEKKVKKKTSAERILGKTHGLERL